MPYSISSKCIGCGTCVKKCSENAISGELKIRFDIEPLFCIECGECFNACPKGAILDPFGKQSPVKKSKKKKRVKASIDCEICACCKNCYINCPRDAISVVKKNIFQVGYCQSDYERCVGCGTCTNCCITGAITLE